MLDLTARELLKLFRTRSLSPVEYARHLVAHIARWEPALGALYLYDPDRLLSEAAQSEARWMAGTPAGMLDGVPVTVKELIATRGDPIPQGSAASPLVPAPADAPIAARLKEAGAIIFAKTTVPDFGMLSSGLSTFHRLARNPWNLACNPGGSSAGASAAAAAGYGPLHVGTDIGGSVRLPAAWCGLVGFKPSLGRIPVDPYYIGRCAGPMTRTVDDAALMMPVLALPDARDATSLPPEAIDWDGYYRGMRLRGLRIGLQLEPGCGLPLDAEIRAAVTAAAERLAELGAEIVPVPPVMTQDMLSGLDDYWTARSWAELRKLPEDRMDKVLPFIRDWASRGKNIDGVRAVDGLGQTFAMRRACAALFESVDAVLSPTTPVVSFPAEFPGPTNDPDRSFDHIVYTVPWNMSEQPAVSINCGFSSDGMPIGLQIVTPRFADLDALRLASVCETARGPITSWPAPPAA
ncbi:amidase [Gluconacetobacter azotocaptans]|uniref:Amidase n=1 Tax=Gluconacetobacter azotocaptans TaxID=142834 RepID=A0A7W4JSL5_9PROT|nr:amidase [Gluconacetobacter azotocaptans]MBB2190166.1 amidase [Gluconacetobacter azotocaptans]